MLNMMSINLIVYMYIEISAGRYREPAKTAGNEVKTSSPGTMRTDLGTTALRSGKGGVQQPGR